MNCKDTTFFQTGKIFFRPPRPKTWNEPTTAIASQTTQSAFTPPKRGCLVHVRGDKKPSTPNPTENITKQPYYTENQQYTALQNAYLTENQQYLRNNSDTCPRLVRLWSDRSRTTVGVVTSHLRASICPCVEQVARDATCPILFFFVHHLKFSQNLCIFAAVFKHKTISHYEA